MRRKIVTALLITLVVLSLMTPALHFGHACTGADCPLCEILWQGMTLWKLAAACVMCVFVLRLFLGASSHAFFRMLFLCPSSPVLRKVRLND
jgi:hypothetical protein